MHIHKGDTVKVLTGDDRGKSGKVLKCLPEAEKVLVQGVNLVWKHLKRSADYPHGARIQKETPVHSSKLMLICANCNKPTRVNYQVSAEGKKNRICKKCKQAV